MIAMRASFLFLAVPLAAFGTPSAERIFRPASHTRGNAGMVARYAIEGASWITHPAVVGKPGEAFIRFRREFDSDGTPFELDVSVADSKLRLMKKSSMRSNDGIRRPGASVDKE